MGKSFTPTYRVEYRDQKGWHTALWNGKASDKLAEVWRVEMNKSFQEGGSNHHLTKAYGFVLHISEVKVIRQATLQVAARAKMPMFEVV